MILYGNFLDSDYTCHFAVPVVDLGYANKSSNREKSIFPASRC